MIWANSKRTVKKKKRKEKNEKKSPIVGTTSLEHQPGLMSRIRRPGCITGTNRWLPTGGKDRLCSSERLQPKRYNSSFTGQLHLDPTELSLADDSAVL